MWKFMFNDKSPSQSRNPKKSIVRNYFSISTEQIYQRNNSLIFSGSPPCFSPAQMSEAQQHVGAFCLVSHKHNTVLPVLQSSTPVCQPPLSILPAPCRQHIHPAGPCGHRSGLQHWALNWNNRLLSPRPCWSQQWGEPSERGQWDMSWFMRVQGAIMCSGNKESMG